MAETVETAIYKMGLQGVEQFAAGAKIMEIFSRAGDKATIVVDKLDKATRVSEERWAKLVGKIDPAVKSTIKIGEVTKTLTDYQGQGIGVSGEYAVVTENMVNQILKGTGITENLGLSFEGLNAKFTAAIPSVEQLNIEFEKLSAGIKVYVKDANLAEAATEVLARSFNTAKAASQKFYAEQRNRTTRAGASGVATGAVVDRAREEQAAADAQAEFNKLLGVRPLTGAQDRSRFGSGLQDLAELEDKAAAAAVRTAARLQQLQDKFDPAGASARRMASEIAELNEYVRLGGTVAGGLEAGVARIAEQYDEGAQAAKRMAEAQRDLIEVERSAQFTRNAQQAFNERLGVSPDSGKGTAAASATVFAEDFRLSDAAQKVRDQLDPTLPVMRAYGVELAHIKELQDKGKLSALEAANANAKLATTYDDLIKKAAGANLAQQFRDKQNPTLPVERARKETLANIDKATSAPGGLTETEKAASIKAANEEYDKQIKVVTGVKKAEDDAAAAAAAYQKQIIALKDELDPLATLQKRYNQEIDFINHARATGDLTPTQQAAGLALARSNLNKNIEALNNHAKATQASTAASRQMQFALTNLSFQVNDVVSSLGAGISPMQTFFQQGGQIFQIGQQVGYKNLLTGVKDGLTALITPFNLAIAGAAALAVGLGVVIAKAIEIQGQARQAGVTLRGMGTSGLASAEGLEKSVRQLREVGIAADDARDAVNKVVRTPGLNPAQTTSLVTTGANLGAIRGTGTAAGTDELISALQGGPEALIKLGTELRKLAPEEVAEIRRQNDIAGSVVASDRAYRLLAERIGGSYKDNMSEAGKAWNDLKNAYNDFITSAAGGSAIKAILDDLAKIPESIKGDLRDIERIIALVQSGLSAIGSAKNYVVGAVGSITSSGERSTVAATAAQKDMTDALAERDRAAGGTGLIRGAERFDTSKISGNTEALQQLTTVLGEASKSLPEGYRLTATSGLRHGTGGSLHNTGDAIDVQIVDSSGRALPNKGPIGTDPGLYKDLAIAAYEANRRLFPDKSLTWGGRFETSAGSGMADWMHFDRGPDRGRLGPPLAEVSGRTTSASAADATRAAPATSTSVFAPVDQTEKLDKQAREYAKANDAARKFADAQVYAEARIRGLAEAESLGIKGTEALTFADRAAQQAVEQRNIERGKASTLADEENRSLLKGVEGFKISEAAGYRVIAEEQARIEVMQRGGDVANRTRQILEEQAGSAIRAGAQQTAAALPQLSALDRLAAATLKGSDAAHAAQLENEAALRTQDALAKAEATRNPGLIAQAKALTDAALAEGKRADAARQSIAAAEAANENKLNLQTISLETKLTEGGTTSEEIQRQVAYLTVAQNLATKYAGASEPTRKSYADTAIAIADANVELQKAQREQEKWNDLVRGLANTIDNELTKSIENAFSEDKVESWGKRIQRWIGTATSSLSSSLFIKPALGTAAGALGFGTVAQGLGSFDSLLGTSTSSASGSGGINVSKASDGSLNITNLSSTASLGNSLFGSGWFDKLGTSLGFASSSKSVSNLSDLGISDAAQTSSGIFGSTTLGSALTGAGAGLGAGITLNSLLGGNKLTGSVGSGVGSIAGTLGGSLLGSPVLGGIAGGLLGSLGGLFGQTNKRANATGVSIDLASGTASGFTSAGSAENDKTVKTIRDDLADFTKTIQSTTKGTLSGYVNPQATDQGIKLDYNIAGYGSGTYTTKDSQDAIDTAELAIARGLTGISDTMKTVIDQITDPTKLDAAIKFADTYDKIATAAADSFASIPSDLDVKGTFAKAKDDIKVTFDDIEADAKKFGLSLTPVTDALEEANKRLTKDFNRYISDLTTAVDDPLQSLVDIEKRAGDARVKDAKAVAGDIEAVNKLNAKNLDKIWTDSTKTLKDLSDELKTGDLSGLTATQRLKSANDNYKTVLADVQAGKTGKFDELVTAAKDVFSLSTSAYGQGPKTATLRTDILKAIDGVLASRSFAGGTAATPPGMILVGERGPELIGKMMPTADRAFAEGTTKTPPGTILVGEKGPELISQPGGLQVYTHRETERIMAAANTNASGMPARSSSISNVIDITPKLDRSLVNRAYAAGTMATPPGMILVGEQGRELMGLPPARSFADGTGHDGTVYRDNWTAPSAAPAQYDNSEELALLRDLLDAMRANTGTARVGHLETGRKIDETNAKLEKAPLPYEPKRRKVA